MSAGPRAKAILAHLGRISSFLVPMLREAVPDAEIVVSPGPADSATAPTADVVVTLGSESRGIEEALTPAVRWVHVLGAGVDGFPLDAAGNRLVTCSKGAAAPAISEFVMATVLAFEKRLPESWIHRREQWNPSASLGGLTGTTMGIVGLGSIGTEVARRALAFGMRVLATRRTGAPSSVAGVGLVPLSELLRQSEHVVICAPATPETHHLIGGRELSEIKAGAHLVNIARGTLIDQDALLAALDDGRVARASLDVAYPEPPPDGHWLYSHPRVRLTPHVSWSSAETGLRTVSLFVENVARYREGRPLEGIVDTARGY